MSNTMSIPFSILDLVPRSDGSSAAQAMHNSIELAQLGDKLGYRRHWFAEHHNMQTVVSTTPEILIALAANATERIQVGSGGVMLPNHAPLQVAEAFKMLESLYPGRINLGLGRAPGTDQATALALRGSLRALQADDFPEKLEELVALGEGSVRYGQMSGVVTAQPPDTALPPIWLLGSSDFSARLSAKLGMGFSFAAHFSDFPPEVPMLTYRDQFQPGAINKPHAILTLSVICADTDQEAQHLAGSLFVSFARLRSGQKPILIDPDDAQAYPFTSLERDIVEQIRPLHIVGSPETVQRRIEDLIDRTQADEVMVTTFTFDHAKRLHSYELLAKTFALQPSKVLVGAAS